MHLLQEIYDTLTGAQSMVQKDIKGRGAPGLNRVQLQLCSVFLETKMS